jgi:hypothetical protein
MWNSAEAHYVDVGAYILFNNINEYFGVDSVAINLNNLPKITYRAHKT